MECKMYLKKPLSRATAAQIPRWHKFDWNLGDRKKDNRNGTSFYQKHGIKNF